MGGQELDMSVVRAAAGLGRIATSFRRGIATATEKKKNLLGTELTLQAARPWSEAAKDGFTGTSLDSIFADKKVVVIAVPGLPLSGLSAVKSAFLNLFDTQVLSLDPALQNTSQVRRLVSAVAKCDSDSASGRIHRRV